MHPTGTDLLVRIDPDMPAARALVGAKAASLQQLMAFGLTVPPALVLSTAFFRPWFAAMAQGPAWRAGQAAQRAHWPALCDELKADALTLAFDAAQRRVFDDLLARLARPAARYAVRSSSPDEDAASASFAGLYQTELGVSPGELENAVRRCFAAAYDHRLVAYKLAQGMDPARLDLALIIQDHLHSDVAGVGFSINPLNNDFDEAVVDASWGLGEAVVGGQVAPDHFVLDKLQGHVIERRAGAKLLAVTLRPDSGTMAQPRDGGPAFCLDGAQLRELNTVMILLERRFGHPVDIEWAFAAGQLHLLQARPITAYVPLSTVMRSEPGARRTLYMDIALSKGMTSNAPISTMGLDWLAGDIGLMLAHAVGKTALDLDSAQGLLYLGGGRMYMNLSKLLWFSSAAQLAKSSAPTDALTASTLGAIDAARYRAPVRPAWIVPTLRALPGMLWRLRRALWRTVRTVLAPAGTHRLYQRECAAFEASYTDQACNDMLDLPAFQRRHGAPVMAHVIDVDMPALGVGILAMGLVKALASKNDPEQQALADQMASGLAGNLVVDMGIGMFQLSQMLAPGSFDDLDALAARLEQRALPAPFLAGWDAFLHHYACRGPGEMDLANARYGDAPRILLRQMAFMASGGGQDPGATHQALAQQRQRAYLALSAQFGWLRKRLLRRANVLIDLFGGARDTPKQHNLLYQHAVRKRLLAEGRKLAAAGRLARADQVFELTHDDLAAAAADPTFDLQGRVAQRTRFAALLRTHVRSFPAVIDSRGRIQRPPSRPEQPGEMRGIAVAPGVARGRVKILRNAHEKSIEPGDILVALTTDPGWTPLFVNAAAVVLEIGGVLQHGAVVAREYGKPCVARIADVLGRFTDGQLVEVDGNAGVVRLLEPKGAPAPARATNSTMQFNPSSPRP